MGKFRIFLELECKRILRLFPMICLTTFLVLTVASCILAANIASEKNKAEEQQKQKMSVGIVMDEGDLPFLEMGLYLVEQTDEIKNIVSFLFVTEEEGQALLEAGEIKSLAIFPKDYVLSVYYGVEEPIVFRFGTAQTGVSSLLFRQLIDAISNYMLESKAGIYTLQDLYYEWDMDESEAEMKLGEKYAMKILNRNKIMGSEKVDTMGGLDPVLYYICVGAVLILLFWGLNCGSILGDGDSQLSLLLERQQFGILKQYGTRFLALLLLFVLSYGAIAIPAWMGLEIFLPGTVSFVSMVQILPVLLMACAMVLLVYEVSQDGVGGMLFFFFVTVILSFLSGFFYPLSYFPIWMQAVADVLPTKVMFDYVSACVKEQWTMQSFGVMMIYTVFFMGLTVCLKKCRDRG